MQVLKNIITDIERMQVQLKVNSELLKLAKIDGDLVRVSALNLAIKDLTVKLDKALAINSRLSA